MKKLAFRFTAMCGAPIETSWRDIKYFPDVTVGEGDVIEYAYAAPVVTEEMAKAAAIAISGAPFPSKRSMGKARAALTAALEPDNAN